MPSYDKVMSRVDAAGDVPRVIQDDIVTGITRQSSVLALGRKVPVTTASNKQMVMTANPEAFWVTGDSGLKQTSRAQITNQSLQIEEIATLVPVPDAVLEDHLGGEDGLWSALQPKIVEAMARRIDSAALFGVDKPASWAPAIVPLSMANGTSVEGAGDDLVADLLLGAEAVGEQGYQPTGAIVRPSWEFAAARQRSNAFIGSPVDADSPFAYKVAGLNIRTGPCFWQPGTDAVVADWTKLLVGMRREVGFEFFKSGTIHDAEGNVMINALQSDITICRATCRVGVLFARPANSDNIIGTPASAVTSPTP